VPGGKKDEFFIPGGASSRAPARRADEPLDMDRATELGTMLRSRAIMVFDETVDPVLVALADRQVLRARVVRQVHACREGSWWIEKVLYRMANGRGLPDDLDLLLDFGNKHRAGSGWPPGMTTICQPRAQHDEPDRQLEQALGRRDPRPPQGRQREARRTPGGIGMTVDAVPMSQWPSDHRYTIPVAPAESDMVTLMIDDQV